MSMMLCMKFSSSSLREPGNTCLKVSMCEVSQTYWGGFFIVVPVPLASIHLGTQRHKDRRTTDIHAGNEHTKTQPLAYSAPGDTETRTGGPQIDKLEINILGHTITNISTHISCRAACYATVGVLQTQFMLSLTQL